jgi:MFS transporter, PAT family, beta-lactamase induction signal transducer AmpG
MNVPHACYLYLAYAVSPENPLSYHTIAFMVGMEKFWYGFGFVGNMLYMMQQIAPGKFKMTHYAFATAFMNLVLVPTQMASGPLADSMGFKSYFLFVFIAAVPSLAAAWLAPFPQSESTDDDSSVDDPSRLDENEKKMQAAARRATIPALLAVALFLLFPDILAFGWMSGTKSGVWLAFLLLLVGASTLMKVVLSLRAIARGRSALELAGALAGGKAYRSNAKGAIIGGGLMLAVSVAVAVACVQRAAATDWQCALSADAGACLPSADAHTNQCLHPTIDR